MRRHTKASAVPHRVAFYPCCHEDIEKPRLLLAGIVDEIIFCDTNTFLPERWARREQSEGPSLPKTTLRLNDLRDEVNHIPVIDVLFYRRDSPGEGGSGVYVLGDSVLPSILRRMNPSGGLIITDGSNSRGSNFKRMKRRSGLIKHGCRFGAPEEQPFLEKYKLWKIRVTPSIPILR